MKRIFLLRTLTLLILFVVIVSSCLEDKKEPFKLSVDPGNYIVREGTNLDVLILSGNNNYIINVADKDIVDAYHTPTLAVVGGYLTVYGKKKGETDVSIKDNVSNDESSISVKVVDYFFSFEIENTYVKRFGRGMSIYLVDNNNKDLYIYGYDDEDNRKMFTKGNYRFLNQEDGKYIVLNYRVDDRDILTTNEKYALSEFKYRIVEEESSLFFIDGFNSGFPKEWRNRTLPQGDLFRVWLEDVETKERFRINTNAVYPIKNNYKENIFD